ncbi:acetate kinase [Acholeplasma sp. OttesenSCG-928-E16]|nr:acetate kinase [Acholeplasma sp. OttesenSCG-928-E16]
MKIISVNAGSSSLKFQLLSMPSEETITSGIVERIGDENGIFTIKVEGKKIVKELPIPTHNVAVDLVLAALLDLKILSSFDEIEGVGHRVVQGGELFKDSAVVNDDVIKRIESLSDLAPLHNPANIIGIKAFMKVLPKVPHVVVFDTTFHSSMTDEAFMYATPYSWYQNYGVRKYGFHGTSHQYVSERAAAILKRDDLKVVVCHIGNGASLCAIKNGKSVDTSMGLTPLEGIPMGTRSGNVDPAVIELIKQKEGLTVEEIISALNKKSGYLGVSGISHDSRDIEDAYVEGNKRAELTLAIQTKRIADYIGSYYVYMGGLDALCFTAGIGENSSYLRKMVCERLGVLGVKLDDQINSSVRGKECLISSEDSKVAVYIIPTNEEVMIAREVMRFIK